MREKSLWIAIVMGLLAGSGLAYAGEELLAPVAPAAPAAPAADGWNPAESDAYRIGPGDTLAIQVFGEDELTGDRKVGASGSLDFPLLGRIDANGLTVQGLDDAITAALGEKYIRNPQVQIVVKTYGSQRVVLQGAVKEPGVYHLTGPTTVLDLIAQAGGVVEAGVSDVRIKHKEAGVPDTLVNLEQQTAQGGGAEPLRAGDIVFVSKPLVIYVDGEVNKPGAVSFTEGLTVTQALTRSGGHKRTAKLSSAYILRGSEKLEINLKHILAGKAADVSLRPNDQLILTESLF